MKEIKRHARIQTCLSFLFFFKGSVFQISPIQAGSKNFSQRIIRKLTSAVHKRCQKEVKKNGIWVVHCEQRESMEALEPSCPKAKNKDHGRKGSTYWD